MKIIHLDKLLISEAEFVPILILLCTKLKLNCHKMYYIKSLQLAILTKIIDFFQFIFANRLSTT